MSIKQVLVVDDDAETRTLARHLVEQAVPSSKVQTADNGQDAMGRIANQFFDLLIMDLNLKKVSGDTILAQVSEKGFVNRPRHIVVLSADLDAMPLQQKRAGVSYVKKPFDQGEFQKILGQIAGDGPASTETPKPKLQIKIDVNFINPFVDATLQVLETMCSTHAEKEKLFVRKGDQISGDISALVAMNGSVFKGSMAIAFEERCFLTLVGRMLGETYTAITPEIQDAAGEICNQVFGSAKKRLNEGGFDIAPAIPSVITGKSHTIKHIVQGPCIAVTFKTDAGNFTIEAVVEAPV